MNAIPGWRTLELGLAARLDADAIFAALGSRELGLSSTEATERLRVSGPNALRRHRTRAGAVLLRQLNNPLLLLLAATAVTSRLLGEQTGALIILLIVGLSVGLGFIDEYRSEQAIEELHARVTHSAVALRDGRTLAVDVADLVPGDVVLLNVGDIVPADVRLLSVNGLECDESVLTGESLPVEKSSAPVGGVHGLLELISCAFMGAVVRTGGGRGIVVRTGSETAFGRIAQRLGTRLPETEFQQGLRKFSTMLVQVTILLCGSIFIVNSLLLHRPLFESLLFALAIAVGLTPQLLPAIVTISLARGARMMARKSVVVKRLVSIEDLGNVEVLFTDKTGTLTEGRVTFSGAFDVDGHPSVEVLSLGLLCNAAYREADRVTGGNPLDRALWAAPEATPVANRIKVAEVPFDYTRRRMSVLVQDQDGRRTIVTKGAPEAVFDCCHDVPASLRDALSVQFEAGARVVAVATRDAGSSATIAAADERDLTPAGLLVFEDAPKSDARESLNRLRQLGIEVKLLTGDNERVALKVWSDLGLGEARALTGIEIERLSDVMLQHELASVSILARMSPEQKSRIIRAQRATGADVGFLGDGVNDAIGLRDADVGISVDSAVDVAKDAADIVLLDKDLGILADGVVEGRRVFANTIKYVLMGTSSNFGNMVSMAGASLIIPFLPMLPSQILLNNLLYDASEMTIPTDRVDQEMLRRPAHWDVGMIRRFMAIFGPINSLFDFAIFGVMIWIFHAGVTLFRTGFFVESFLTQTLLIFALRTRRVPFFRSRPSAALALTTLGATAVGAALPFSPLAGSLGFAPLPAALFAVLMAVILTVYFALVEVAKIIFYRHALGGEDR